MKKAFANAKEPLFVSLYFITVYSVSLCLTILTHWNFGVFFFWYYYDNINNYC